MNSLALQQTLTWKLAGQIWKVGHSLFEHRFKSVHQNKSATAEHDLFIEIMHSHPEAFQSGTDFQNLASYYHSKF